MMRTRAKDATIGEYQAALQKLGPCDFGTLSMELDVTMMRIKASLPWLRKYNFVTLRADGKLECGPELVQG